MQHKVSRSGEIGSGAKIPLFAAAQVFSAVLALVFVAVIGRTLPINELGLFLYWLALATGLEALSDLGLRFVGTSRLSASSGRSGRLMRQLFVIKISLSAILVGVLAMASGNSWLAGIDTNTAILIGLAASTLPSSNPFIWRLRSMGRQEYEAGLIVAYRALLILLGLFTEYESASGLFSFLLMANFSHFVAAGAASLSVANPAGPMAPGSTREPGSSTLWSLLALSIPFGVTVLSAQMIPRVYMGSIAANGTEAELAAVTLAFTILMNSTMGSVALGAILMPKMRKISMHDTRALADLIRKMLSVAWAIGLLFAICFVVFAALIGQILLGESLDELEGLLPILAWSAPVLSFSMASRYVLAAFESGILDASTNMLGLAVAFVGSGYAYAAAGMEGLAMVYLAMESIGALLRGMSVRGKIDESPVMVSQLLLWTAMVLGIVGIVMILNGLFGERSLLIESLVGAIAVVAAILLVGQRGGIQDVRDVLRS